MPCRFYESDAGVMSLRSMTVRTPAPRAGVAGEPALADAVAARSAPYNTLGLALAREGDIAGALSCFARSVESDPRNAPAWNNVGWMHQSLGQFPKSEEALRRAIELSPGFAAAHANLAQTQLLSGRPREANDTYRSAIALDPGSAAIRSNALIAMSYDDRIGEHEIFQAHRDWESTAIHAPDTAPFSTARTRDPDRELRVGFMSSCFNRHPVGRLVEPLWQALAGHGLRVIPIHTGPRVDALTEALRALSDEWHPAESLGPAALVARTRALDLDLLIDLDGHTRVDSMLAIARRLAPVQLAWLGYFATTGVGAVDYLLTDSTAVPAGSASCFTETILRMPGPQWCRSPADVPTRAVRSGAVTFGCFNNLAKLGDGCIDAWSTILANVPDSRLELRALGLEDASVAGGVLARFTRRGISATRIGTGGYMRPADYQATLAGLDIALDPFPFSGGATSLDTLAAGVPIVSLLGDRMAGRLSASLLRAAGLGKLVCDSKERYVETAISLARSPDERAAARATLARTMRASRLCDPPAFAGDFAGLLRGAWLRWCNEP